MRTIQDLFTALAVVGCCAMLLSLSVMVISLLAATTVPPELHQATFVMILMTTIGYVGALIAARVRMERTLTL